MKTIFTILVFALSFCLVAQDAPETRRRFELSVGAVSKHSQRFDYDGKIDFLNYAWDGLGFPHFLSVNASYFVDLFPRFSAEFKLSLFGGPMEVGVGILGYYKFNNSFSIGGGYQVNQFDFFDFDELSNIQIQQFPDYYTAIYGSYPFRLQHSSFVLKPRLSASNSKNLEATLSLSFGVSSFFIHDSLAFIYKKKLSNERITHSFNNKISYTPFVNPEFELRFDAFRFSGRILGLKLGSSLLFTRQRMNYTHTIREWLPENATRIFVERPKHSFLSYEFDIGLFWKW